MDKMDKAELQQHDGKEGRRTLVAFNGKIYDVTDSKLWRNGVHLKTHHAGNDLTHAMKAAPHGPEVMERYLAIAELVEEKVTVARPTAMKTPSPLVAWILSQHPHPMSVHFPIALCIMASVMTLLSLYVHEPALQKAALYNMIFAALATPGSVVTGLLSWYYNYSGIWTHIYRMKTLLSIILAVLLTFALTIHFAFLPGSAPGGLWYWLYTWIVLAMAPTVMGLGYYGGKITFPS